MGICDRVVSAYCLLSLNLIPFSIIIQQISLEIMHALSTNCRPGLIALSGVNYDIQYLKKLWEKIILSIFLWN